MSGIDGEIVQQWCGEWRLEREIGQGAYGVVYLAVGLGGERVAVKVCRRDAVGDERYVRELRGAKLYRAIPPQEGLVRMRELVETEWGFYTVMELADDEFDRDAPPESYRPKTLAKVIEGEKALPLKECVKLGIALAGGLATLQRHHLLHRDIKPGNVIYVGGKPVLSDPGLIVEESESASLVGTPGYVPPEKFTEAASDIYSLGLTLKAASFGRNVEDLDKGPALEADTGAPLFAAWWRILNKATDPTPSRRYQSAKALLKDIEGLRRKMFVASVAEARIAKAALALAVLGAVAIVASSVISSRRAKEEIARQSEEVKALKAGLMKQPAESKALKDDLARQSAENESLKADLARQSEEIKSLKEDLLKLPVGDKALKATLAKQSAENKMLKEKVAKQTEEIEPLKKFKTDTETQFARAERETLWPFFTMTSGLDYERHFGKKIDDVAKTNQVRAAEMRTLVARIVELQRKSNALAEKCRGLHDIAEKKAKDGLDDEKEYLQAKKMNAEKRKFHDEIILLCKELGE